MTMRLLKNAHVVDCEREGVFDLLLCGEKILAVEPNIDIQYADLEVLDLEERTLIPGLIDIHVHVTGGGGELGFSSRVPECRISELIRAGVTTILGLLGTDVLTRSLENLLAKVNSLEQEGITAYMLTGGYPCPPPTLCGSVMRDLVLIDRVIGVKTAQSDHRSSAPSIEQFARLCAEARVGGMISGKAGLTVVHMGDSPKGFAPIYEMLTFGDVPMKNILPTHCGRNERLFQEALKYAAGGGSIDLTAASGMAGEKTAAAYIREALERGISPALLSISSDSYGSMPRFNEQKECIGCTYSKGPVLLQELSRMVREEQLSLREALRPLTLNPACRIGLEKTKGLIAKGYDADLILMGEDFRPERVWAKGREALTQGRTLIRGCYEE